jgi:hypothetical protein
MSRLLHPLALVTQKESAFFSISNPLIHFPYPASKRGIVIPAENIANAAAAFYHRIPKRFFSLGIQRILRRQ